MGDLPFDNRRRMLAMSVTAFPWRRAALVAVCVLPLFVLFEAYTVYSDLYAQKAAPTRVKGTMAPGGGGFPTKTSQVHYVMPASSANDKLCAVVASALANRFPAPYLIGWRGEGRYNATAAHTAKLYSLKRYLDGLPQGGDEDDLVIFGDGHDVMAQLPADVLVERYFAAAADADGRLADRFGTGVDEARARGRRQTLFWGADKMCWPPLRGEAQCADAPRSHLPRNIYGHKSGNGDSAYADPRFFNSGSVVGPLGDLRAFVSAGVEAIEKTFDPAFRYRSSDQVYLARLWARQEASRAAQMEAHGGDVEEEEEEEKGEVAEYHAAVDYESALVQTGCYNHNWMRRLRYNGSDHTAILAEDVFDQGPNFRPHAVQMPAVVYRSLARVFRSLPDLRQRMAAHDWVGGLGLDTNVATRRIFCLYHATCSKRDLVRDFKRYWFHPYLEALLRAAARAARAGEPMAEELIDGRRWAYKTSYPEDAAWDGLGGVYTDYEAEAFIPFGTLCKEHWDLFES